MAKHYDCEGNLGDLAKLGFEAFADGDTASAPAEGEAERQRALWRCVIDRGERTLQWTKVGPWSVSKARELAGEAERIVRVPRGARGMVPTPAASRPEHHSA